ncbi:lipoprotein [Streptomyces ruber]|uniref:Lipoprotein n=2 Tax=Streptomyces TaxID=1883 RepID=A0A918ENM3_9ACTN|nr:hypothetical protein [Streptomyces ruber]GGQ41626.1 lipoprotein [Streptomyces ruber]
MVSAVCALMATGTGLTGCSKEDPDAGTNGVGKLSATQIQSRTQAAARAAGTVHLSGTVVSNGRTYKLDMQLAEDGGTGSVTSEDSTFRLLRVGEQLFLKADKEFWTHEDGDEGDGAADAKAADKLDGMFVKVPADDPVYQRFSGFTDKDVLLDGLLTLHGKLTKGERHERSGVRTIRVTGDAGSGGTLDVSLEGTPYPLLLVRAGDAGTIRLSDWGEEVPLEEPEEDEVVDYGQQLPSS